MATAVLVTSLAAITPAVPSGPLPPVVALFETQRTQLVLVYARSDCISECPVAAVICRDGRVDVWLTELNNATVVAWVFDPELAGRTPSAALVLDGVPHALLARELSQGGGGDMHDNWWVRLLSDGAWLAEFGRAAETLIRTPYFEIPLPSTEADRTARAEFVAACLAVDRRP